MILRAGISQEKFSVREREVKIFAGLDFGALIHTLELVRYQYSAFLDPDLPASASSWAIIALCPGPTRLITDLDPRRSQPTSQSTCPSSRLTLPCRYLFLMLASIDKQCLIFLWLDEQSRQAEWPATINMHNRSPLHISSWHVLVSRVLLPGHLRCKLSSWSPRVDRRCASCYFHCSL